MSRNTFGIWAALTWLVTLGIAYIVGWYKGVRGTVNVATGAAHSSMNFVLIALVVVALVSAVAALRARGYIASHSHGHPTT